MGLRRLFPPSCLLMLSISLALVTVLGQGEEAAETITSHERNPSSGPRGVR